jgi:hypothetical protein
VFALVFAFVLLLLFAETARGTLTARAATPAALATTLATSALTLLVSLIGFILLRRHNGLQFFLVLLHGLSHLLEASHHLLTLLLGHLRTLATIAAVGSLTLSHAARTTTSSGSHATWST